MKVVYGEPIVVKKKIDAETEESIRLELEKRLKSITEEADEA